jgi:hypothetical protein
MAFFMCIANPKYPIQEDGMKIFKMVVNQKLQDVGGFKLEIKF